MIRVASNRALGWKARTSESLAAPGLQLPNTYFRTVSAQLIPLAIASARQACRQDAIAVTFEVLSILNPSPCMPDAKHIPWATHCTARSAPCCTRQRSIGIVMSSLSCISMSGMGGFSIIAVFGYSGCKTFRISSQPFTSVAKPTKIKLPTTINATALLFFSHLIQRSEVGPAAPGKAQSSQELLEARERGCEWQGRWPSRSPPTAPIAAQPPQQKSHPAPAPPA